MWTEIGDTLNTLLLRLQSSAPFGLDWSLLLASVAGFAVCSLPLIVCMICSGIHRSKSYTRSCERLDRQLASLRSDNESLKGILQSESMSVTKRDGLHGATITYASLSDLIRETCEAGAGSRPFTQRINLEFMGHGPMPSQKICHIETPIESTKKDLRKYG
jgi:hypothetical protein